MIFATRVNGIPCQCKVLHHLPAVPMVVYGSCISDFSEPEPEEFDFELLDRKGYKAKWLDRYVSPDVEERLSEEFHIMQKADYFQPADY